MRVPGDRRDLVVDHRVARDHHVLRVLVLPHERRQAFHQPRRRIGGDGLAELPLKEDLVLEDVGQLVLDDLEQLLVGRIDGDDHAVPRRLRKRSHTLGDEVQVDVGLFEGRVRGVVDQRDLFRDLVVQLPRQIVVRALRVVDHLLQRRLLLVVEVHVEVRGVVDVPVEPVIDDLVLTEGERGNREKEENHQQRERTLH